MIHDCKIELTKTFAESRLQVLLDAEYLKAFARLYGQQHLNNITHWYKTIAQ